MSTLVSSKTSSQSANERAGYCRRTSEEVRQLQKMYAQNAKTRNESPQAYRLRMSFAERINELLASVSLEEQREYDIW